MRSKLFFTHTKTILLASPVHCDLEDEPGERESRKERKKTFALVRILKKVEARLFGPKTWASIHRPFVVSLLPYCPKQNPSCSCIPRILVLYLPAFFLFAVGLVSLNSFWKKKRKKDKNEAVATSDTTKGNNSYSYDRHCSSGSNSLVYAMSVCLCCDSLASQSAFPEKSSS